MATLIDYVRHFQRSSCRYELRSDAIATYYSILEMFNSARFPESLTIATDILQRAAGISRRDKFYEARNLLKELGLIEFKSNRAKGNARYTMPIDGETDPNSSLNRRFIPESQYSNRPQTRPRGREYDRKELDNGSIIPYTKRTF